MDENHIVKNNIELPEGKYYVKELYVSNPYSKLNDKFNFSVEYTNTSDNPINVTINNGKVTNVAKTVEFELLVYPDVVFDELNIKDIVDRDDLEELAKVYGITNKVYGCYNDKECSKPVITIDDKEATFETNEDGIINIPDMPTGTYYFKELQAPYGYDLSDEGGGKHIGDKAKKQPVDEIPHRPRQDQRKRKISHLPREVPLPQHHRKSDGHHQRNHGQQPGHSRKKGESRPGILGIGQLHDMGNKGQTAPQRDIPHIMEIGRASCRERV